MCLYALVAHYNTWNGACVHRRSSVTSARNKRLVCIVDDDLDIVELFHDALRSIKGVVVFKFTNPIIALEHIKINKDEYVLLISDLRMPGLDGLELIRRTKKLNRNIRTLLMTAFDLDDKLFREYTRREIINGFLQKPIKIEKLRLEANIQIHAHEIYV
jgi:two-component system response regulator (stage 0 sporulation protein F)